MPRALWPFLADRGAPCGCSPRFPVVSTAAHPPWLPERPRRHPAPNHSSPNSSEKSATKVAVWGGWGWGVVPSPLHAAFSELPANTNKCRIRVALCAGSAHVASGEASSAPSQPDRATARPLKRSGSWHCSPGFKINSPFPRPQPSCPEKALPGGNTRLALLTDSDLRGTVFQVRRQDERLGRPPLMKPRKEGK